jgi:hypothetical protein
MAYDRYDPRQRGRNDRPRWSDDRFEPRDHNLHDRDERGFFERASDEVASWFGDDDAERRRDRDDRMSRRDRHFDREREVWGGGDRSENYRPITGDYGRSEGTFAPSGSDRGDNYWRNRTWDRPQSRDELRRSSFGGSSERGQRYDPHYQEWRQRQIDSLDRDYDDYRREHQSKFESDFGGWRERRQSKRQLLGTVREHMDVIGNDEEHVGTVDRVAGDRLILTKSDPDSGGVHHSISCTDIDRIEETRVILDCSAEQAKRRWRDESRGRALFEREDSGEAGPHMLDRSFSGTYR